MGLLAATLFQPVQEWIKAELGTPSDSAVAFRFDRFGMALADADFKLSGQPQDSYSRELAVERFSDLVNRIPLGVESGQDITFSEADIDTAYYYRLLSPAQPLLPSSLDAAARRQRIEAFSALKAKGLRLWEQLGNASVTGQLIELRPATAQPVNWYDRACAEGWKSRTIHVRGSSQAQPADELRWRLRPDDVRVGSSLGLAPDELRHIPPLQLTRRAALIQRGELTPPRLVPMPDGPTVGVPPKLPIEILPKLGGLPLSERLLAKRRLLEAAQTKPATTTSDTTITFDACLVRISRPWLFWPLLDDATWYVPGVSREGVTRGAATGSLAWLPTAFLAIRNFKVTAQWSQQDVAASQLATNLGPFSVTSQIVDGVLANPGLQVVGWQLERLPALPPNDAPAAVPPRHYAVVKGDTLARIALTFYGDRERWPEIAEANNLTEPDKLEEGQQLTIP